jgi:hypothetical protein
MDQRKRERIARANARRAARDGRTAREQWILLDGRPGASKRERARLRPLLFIETADEVNHA